MKRLTPAFLVLMFAMSLLETRPGSAAPLLAAELPSDAVSEPEPTKPTESTASEDVAEPEQTADSTSAVGFGVGLRAYYDPVTGTYLSRGTPQQTQLLSKELELGLSRSADGLTTFALDDGQGVGVYLGDYFRSAAVAVMNDDGSISFRCTHNEEQIETRPTEAKPSANTTHYEDM